LEISDSVNLDEYSFEITQDARQAVSVGGSIGMTAGSTITAEQAGTITINGESVEIQAGDTADEVYSKLQELCDWTGNKIFVSDDLDNTSGLDENAGYSPSSNAFGNGGNLVIVSDYYGSAEQIEISCSNDKLSNLLGIKDGLSTGSDVQVNLDYSSGFSPTAVVATSGNLITISDNSGFEMTFEAKLGACGTEFKDPAMGGDLTSTASGGDSFTANIKVLEAGQMVFQIGANKEETMTVTIPQMSTKNLGIDDINVVCGSDASAAISKVDAAISKVSAVRGKLGAYQNRLEHAESNLEVSEESMTNSLSRIMDCDMAEEITEYTQQNLLVQTATNMLAKASARPESVLQLLQQT
jgi:flagellin